MKVAALLVLAISAPLSEAHRPSNIPPRIFSYSVTLLGRISHALKNVMNQNTLLTYLSYCSKSTMANNSGSLSPMIEGDIPNFSCVEMINPAHMPLPETASEIVNQKRLETREPATPLLDSQLEGHTEVMKSIKLILLKINDVWVLVQKGCMDEVLKILRCKLFLFPSCFVPVLDTLLFLSLSLQNKFM